MKHRVFAARNVKELLRAPYSLLLGVGTPVALIALISFVVGQAGGGVEIFSIRQFAPGMLVFSGSFLALFLGACMAGDKSSAYMMRLLTTPLKSRDYILGYGLAVLPLALVQALACLATAALFGLPLTRYTALGVLALLPAVLLHVGMGLLLGSLFGNTALVSGFGAAWVGASLFFGGVFIPIEAIGGNFKKLCDALPFAHANKALALVLAGNMDVLQHIALVLLYAAALLVLAAFVFKRHMRP